MSSRDQRHSGHFSQLSWINLLSFLILVSSPWLQVSGLRWEKVTPQPPGIKPIFDQACSLYSNTSAHATELMMYAGDRFPNGSFINQMQFFNFSSRKWRIGEQHSLTLIPSARGAPATLIHGSVMLVFGGAEEPGASLGDTWEFDFGQSLWTEYTPDVGKGPSRRYASTVVWSDAMECALLFGGSYWQEMLYYNDLWCYDFGQHEWRELSVAGSSPPPRFAHIATVTPSGQMFVYGGSSHATGQLDDLWVFDSKAMKWGEVMTSTPPGRGWAQGVVLDGWWYVVGGSRNKTDNIDVWKWRLDPAASHGGWQEMAIPSPHPEKRMAHCAVIFQSDIYIVGGYSLDEKTSVSDMWKLNLNQ